MVLHQCQDKIAASGTVQGRKPPWAAFPNQKRPCGLFRLFLPAGLADFMFSKRYDSKLIASTVNAHRMAQKKRPRTRRGQSDREEVTPKPRGHEAFGATFRLACNA
jgi:hypothetical protein